MNSTGSNSLKTLYDTKNQSNAYDYNLNRVEKKEAGFEEYNKRAMNNPLLNQFPLLGESKYVDHRVPTHTTSRECGFTPPVVCLDQILASNKDIRNVNPVNERANTLIPANTVKDESGFSTFKVYPINSTTTEDGHRTYISYTASKSRVNHGIHIPESVSMRNVDYQSSN